VAITIVEGIFAFEPGDIAVVRFLAQYFESKLKDKIGLACHFTMTQDYLPLRVFGEQMIGIYSCQDYLPSFVSQENEHFTKLYKAKYKDIPNVYNEGGYTGMKWICATLKSINGNIENKEAFLSAMSATKIQAPCSVLSFDKNNNVVRDFLIAQVEKSGDRVENVVKKVIPQVHQPPEGYTRPEKK
jgi:branched-chain amino acid transport system substrate-binding protein